MEGDVKNLGYKYCWGGGGWGGEGRGEIPRPISKVWGEDSRTHVYVAWRDSRDKLYVGGQIHGPIFR